MTQFHFVTGHHKWKIIQLSSITDISLKLDCTHENGNNATLSAGESSSMLELNHLRAHKRRADLALDKYGAWSSSNGRAKLMAIQVLRNAFFQGI